MAKERGEGPRLSTLRKHGHPDYFAKARSLHRSGVLAELAFASYYRLPFLDTWTPDQKTGDVAGVHVRSTAHRDGCLRIHDTDEDHRPYFLVIRDREDTRFRIAGWLRGAEAKRIGWRGEPENGRPCILVVQAKLRKPPVPQAATILEAA